MNSNTVFEVLISFGSEFHTFGPLKNPKKTCVEEGKTLQRQRKKNAKKTTNDQQNTTQKTQDWAKWTKLKTAVNSSTPEVHLITIGFTLHIYIQQTTFKLSTFSRYLLTDCNSTDGTFICACVHFGGNHFVILRNITWFVH